MKNIKNIKNGVIVTLLLCFVMMSGKNVFAGDRSTSIYLNGRGSVETSSYKNYEGFDTFFKLEKGNATTRIYVKGCHSDKYILWKTKKITDDNTEWSYYFNPDVEDRAYVKLSNNALFGSKARVKFIAYGGY